MTDPDPLRDELRTALGNKLRGMIAPQLLDGDFGHVLADAVLSVLPECRCSQLEQVGWRAVIEDSDELVPWRPTPWEGSAPMEPVYVLRDSAAVPYTEETPNG